MSSAMAAQPTRIATRAKKPHDEYDAERSARHPSRTLSQHEAGDGMWARAERHANIEPLLARAPHAGQVEIVGFGFAAFVKKTFAEAEVQNPRPGLNARIIESIVAGNSVAATYEEVRDANTRSDLEQVIFDTSWKHGRLDPTQVDEVRVLLGRAYQELFAGYRLSRKLMLSP
jgi:hypothetical protein